MIRKFELINEYGQSYGLSDYDSGFVNAPSGLGYEIDASYSKIGTSWIRNYFRDQQGTIKATVIFGGSDPYLSAAGFFRYIRVSKDLALKYTTNAGEYLRRVDVVSVDKTEMTSNGVLEIPITMRARSLWVHPEAIKYIVDFSALTDETRYAYRFAARFRDYASGILHIVNDGSVAAPFAAVIEGPVLNPSIVLNQHGEDIARVDITAQVGSGESIEYSSEDGNIYCIKRSGSTITNLAGTFNLNNANFFKIPVGESDITIDADTALTAPATITVYKQYRAV